MAAAAAAAASSPSDGDVQPCKKRKEDDPPIKAITKYFSPLGKNVDRLASPPKPNNIMDYFKKTSLTNEKIVSPVTEKESKTTSLSLENSSKSSSRLKRRGKRCNLTNTLTDVKTLDVVIEINSDDSREILSPEEKDSKASSISPNVSTLPGPTNVEEMLNGCSKNPLNIVGFKSQEGKIKMEGDKIKANVKRSKKRKHKDESDLPACFVIETQQKDLYKVVDDKQVVNEYENESLVNMQDHDTSAHETPHLNDNTVTISFEDFLKSQGENNVDHIAKAQTLDNSIACDETDRYQEVQQLPLKKVTVLAQIHSVPPKSPSSQKIASIFLKQKPKKVKRQSSPSASEGEVTEHMTQKRKSNVVIAEEELELAILETSGSEAVKSKCTAEERYQFMKAFKQPESETVKTGVKKGPGKQKEAGGKSLKHKLELEECEDVSNEKLEHEVSTVYTNCSSHDEDNKNDSGRVRTDKLKRKKKIQKTKEKDLNMNNNQNSEVNDQIKAETSKEIQSELPQKNKGLRRSPRQKKGKDAIQCTPEKAEITEAVTESTPPAIPLQASTPKTNNRMLSKSDLYKAEMITESLDSKSPIRMKFTRISIAERFMQQNIKVNTNSNNISKAKKLVEKAKVLQHNRKTRIVEDTLHTPLRRSSRQQAIADRKRSRNMEDSVIILDLCTSNISTAVGIVEKQKKLQNLNDVLGKKAGNMKASKKSNGKENVSSLVRKKIKKPTEEEAITILHENSEDDSENSQDDKQFRAKREFLMSGLPESLKRQITKKAAALEAYSLANSCFRTVVHVQQKDEGCLMWRLVLPSCPLLTNLREVDSDVTDVAKLTFSLGEFSVLNAQPHSIDSQIIVPSGWRPAFSDAQKNCLLEEIQSCNVHFPVKQFFDLIMKKQAAPEKNKQVSKCEVVNSETSRKTDNRKKAKRKRQTEDHKSRRRKSVENTEIDLPNKVSKVLNVKQGGMENTSHITDTHETEEFETLTIEDSDLGSEISAVSDFTHEDILWTEKYQPQNSSELIGNTVAIKKLHRWLCEWKRRADWEEKRNQKEESNSQQESSDSMDFQDDKSDSEDETMLCNTMLLIGPPGIGKTAAVYACAQELGFKIFEVNASCQRSGRQILSHLKEATQSHQVDKQGVHAHKPSFFNSYSSSKSPKKKSPRKEWSPRKSPVSPRKVGLKQGLAPRTLANYFKISSKPPNKENAQGSNKENKETSYGENTQIKSVKGEIKEDESSKKCATSLILFEEVDIIFEEDVGFLNAIKTFMTTTKRPVILTTNDPSFSLIFDGCFEEITFSTPSLINVASYLQVLCLGENLRTDIKDFAALLTSNNCDIRQSILHLQFWVKSGGGYLKEKGLALQGQGKETSHTEQGVCIKEPTTTKIRNPDPLVKIPKCNTGCIENLLGLTNIFLPSEDLFSFLKHEITTKEEWNKLIHLLTEFQRKNIDFIYSNLENILPLPVNILPEPMHVPNLLDKNFTKSSSNNGPNDNDCLRDTSPVKKAKQTKRRRKIVILDDSDLFESELNYSGFITVPSDTNGSCLEEKPECTSTGALNDETTAKAKGCVLTFQCLNSLTEFVDNMSLSDCCFSWRTQASTPPCKYEEFIWTKGKIKNGLSDEFSVEDADWWTSQSSIELKATMEALNFNKCFKNISKIKENALNTARIPRKNELEDVPLHISKDQPNLYFGQPAANSRIQHNAQKRLELIESVFSGRNPLNFSNRQASVMEYLPTLRNICKSEKQKEQGRTKRRFLHYLEGIHLPKEILNTLATDFP